MLDVIFLRPDDEVRNPFLLKSYNHRQSRALMRLGLTLIISPKWGHCGLWMSGHFIPASRSCCSVSDQKSLFFSQIALPHLVFVFGFVFFAVNTLSVKWSGLFTWLHVNGCVHRAQIFLFHMFCRVTAENLLHVPAFFFFFCLLDDERATVDTQICKVKLGVSSSPEPVLQFEWLQSSVISFPATRWLSP